MQDRGRALKVTFWKIKMPPELGDINLVEIVSVIQVGGPLRFLWQLRLAFLEVSNNVDSLWDIASRTPYFTEVNL